MTRAEREVLLRALLAGVVGRPQADIPEGAHLREDLGLDSLMVVELLASLSDELGLGLDIRMARALSSRLGASTVGPLVEELLDVLEHLDEVVEVLHREEADALADEIEPS
jgi:acyl carrier protein